MNQSRIEIKEYLDTISSDILSGSIEEVKNNIDMITDKYITKTQYFRYEIETSPDNYYGVVIQVYGIRYETPDEYNERIGNTFV